MMGPNNFPEKINVVLGWSGIPFITPYAPITYGEEDRKTYILKESISNDLRKAYEEGWKHGKASG
jgi:hypothetical protein